jgi:hypothetical protein
MPPRSQQPEKGQPTLPGLEPSPSLGHLLTPEAAGIDSVDYADITEEMLLNADPTLLRQSLIGVNRGGRSVVWYKPNPRGSYVNLAVNPEDYNHIARNIPALSRAVVNRTLERYPSEVQFDRDKQAAAERSGLHAVEVKLPFIKSRLNELVHQRELLDIVQEMTKPTSLNLGRGYVARSRFHELMGDVIANMVNAVGNHRKYDTEAMIRMRKSLEARLYLAPERVGQRQEYMGQLVDVANEYYGHLVIMYATRRYEAEKFLRDNPAPTA